MHFLDNVLSNNLGSLLSSANTKSILLGLNILESFPTSVVQKFYPTLKDLHDQIGDEEIHEFIEKKVITGRWGLNISRFKVPELALIQVFQQEGLYDFNEITDPDPIINEFFLWRGFSIDETQHIFDEIALQGEDMRYRMASYIICLSELFSDRDDIKLIFSNSLMYQNILKDLAEDILDDENDEAHIAERIFKKLIVYNPMNLDYRLQLALSLFRQEKYEEVESVMLKARALSNTLVVNLRICTFYFAAKMPKKGAAFYFQIVRELKKRTLSGSDIEKLITIFRDFKIDLRSEVSLINTGKTGYNDEEIDHHVQQIKQMIVDVNGFLNYLKRMIK